MGEPVPAAGGDDGPAVDARRRAAEPVARALPGLSAPVEPGRLFQLLRDDAEIVSTLRTGAQEAALRGVGTEQLEAGGAIWTETPEGQAQMQAERKAEVQARRKQYFDAWGRWPDW